MNKKSLVATSLLATGLLLSSTQTWSVSLTTAGDYLLPGTSYVERPELGGVVLEDMITDFSISGAGENLTGTIQNRVIRSNDGTVDFSWRITSVSGMGDLSAFRVIGFDGYTLDADWRTDGDGNVSPTTARYFGDGSGAVNFLFDRIEVGPNDQSYFFFLDTNATHYDLTGQFDLLCADTGCISSGYDTFAPSAVPVPAAVWLFGSGLVGLLGIARRKQIS